MQAGRTSEGKKKIKEELELRLKLLSEMEEMLKDDGEHALYAAYVSHLHAVTQPPIIRGAVLPHSPG